MSSRLSIHALCTLRSPPINSHNGDSWLSNATSDQATEISTCFSSSGAPGQTTCLSGPTYHSTPHRPLAETFDSNSQLSDKPIEQWQQETCIPAPKNLGEAIEQWQKKTWIPALTDLMSHMKNYRAERGRDIKHLKAYKVLSECLEASQSSSGTGGTVSKSAEENLASLLQFLESKKIYRFNSHRFCRPSRGYAARGGLELVEARKYGGKEALDPHRKRVLGALQKDLQVMLNKFRGSDEKIRDLMKQSSQNASVNHALTDMRDRATLSTHQSDPSPTPQGSIRSSIHVTATSAVSFSLRSEAHPDEWTTIANWVTNKFKPAARGILPALFVYLQQDQTPSDLIGHSPTEFEEIMQNLWGSLEESCDVILGMKDRDRLAEIADRLWEVGRVADGLWKSSLIPTTRSERFSKLAICILQTMPSEERERAIYEELHRDQAFQDPSRSMEPTRSPYHMIQPLLTAMDDPQVTKILGRHMKELKEREHSCRSY